MPDPQILQIPQEKTAKIPIKEHFQLKETIVTIAADNQAHIEAAKEAIRIHRAALEMYILSDPYFQLTLEPYECPQNCS